MPSADEPPGSPNPASPDPASPDPASPDPARTDWPALTPLIVSAGILLAGNGLLVTLVAVRANLEGFSAQLVGYLGAAYFAGFIVACLVTPGLILRAGHIRVFAALSSLGAVAALVLALTVEPWIWLASRALTGFAFAGLATVVESWLNARAAAAERGRVLSIYRLVDLSCVTGGQFLLPWIGAEGFAIFVVVAIFFCLALLPISLSRQTSPAPPANPRLDVRRIWRLSPVACVGCLTIGLTNGAFRTVGPIYAQETALDLEQLALFMSLAIAGGALLQIPLGWLSDRIDRRWVLILATVGATGAGLWLSAGGAVSAAAILAGGFLFGAFAMPLYSLSIAHGNDHASPADRVELSATLILMYGLGAVVGPLAAGQVMAWFGAPAFFAYTSVFHALFLLFVAYRMSRRAGVPQTRRGRFVALLRTSPAFYQLARRAKGKER
jgi:MFS family permease